MEKSIESANSDVYYVKAWKQLCDTFDTRSLLHQIVRTHSVAQSGLEQFDRLQSTLHFISLECNVNQDPNGYLQEFNTEYQRWSSADPEFHRMRTETLVAKFLSDIVKSHPKYQQMLDDLKNDAIRNRTPLPASVEEAAEIAQHWHSQYTVPTVN